MSEQHPIEPTAVRGMYRIQIEEDGTIVGDSGWEENQITNLGFNYFLVGALGGSTLTSAQIGFLALGTGGIIAASGTSLDGEVTKRQAVTRATSSTSKTLRLTGTFASSDGFVTGTGSNISNVGLFASSSAGTCFAGSTYTSSNCGTNQNVNVTYDIVFS